MLHVSDSNSTEYCTFHSLSYFNYFTASGETTNIESQHNLGWKGALEIAQSNPMLKAGLIRSSCSGTSSDPYPQALHRFITCPSTRERARHSCVTPDPDSGILQLWEESYSLEQRCWATLQSKCCNKYCISICCVM